MKQESWGRRVWRLLYPGLVYYGICFFVQTLVTLYISFQTIVGYDSASLSSQMNEIFNEILNRTLSVALELQVIGAVLTLPLLILFYRMDRKRDRIAGREHCYTKVSAPLFVLIAVLGAVTCLAGNNLIMVSGLYSVSSAYDEVSEVLYGGKLVLEFVGLGLLIPIVEELIFRGLIYRRLREYTSLGTGAVLSALIFGIYHGNLVQGVYAFLLGLLFVYVYERYHTMAAPILFHMAANLLSVLGSETGALDWMYGSLGVFWGVTVICCLLIVVMVYLIERFVHSTEILPETPPVMEDGQTGNTPVDPQ